LSIDSNIVEPTGGSTADSGSGNSGDHGTRASLLRKAGFLLSTVVLLAGFAVQLSPPSVVVSVRDAVFDGYQRAQPRPYQSAPVRIVDIDEATLSRLGQWPWPRTRVAELVAKLRDLGAASIAFDVLFSEPDRTSPHRLAAEWSERQDVRDVLSTLPDHDEVLASEISRGNVVTAFALSDDVESTEQPIVHARFLRMGDSGALNVSSNRGAVNSLAALAQHAAGNGSINFSPGADGVVRRVPLVLALDDALYPSLLLEALRVALGQKNIVITADPPPSAGSASAMTTVRVGPLSIPTDSTGHARVYLTEPFAERYVPAWKVIEGQADDLISSGTIVFVGSSATGLQDLRFGTLGEVLPGVEIHAQLLEQILQGTYIQRPAWALGAEMFIVLVTWFGMLLLASRDRAVAAAFLAMAGVGVAVQFGFYQWTHYQVLIDPAMPALLIAATFLSFVVPRQVAAEREQRWVRGVFANYLSPNLVDHIIHNPSVLRLGGERRECSFVLTDVIEFTNLVESSDPHELMGVINDYLDGMVSIAFRHEGTLDRIVGDAVAVLFSAPVTQPDHAERAVACAIEMDRFATDYSKRCEARGIPFKQTCIGVHTGEVVVGNFGGSSHFDYRPLGDPINTTARLETVNRQLGTNVCVSEATAAKCKGFAGRSVGRLLLKGKSRPLGAFEPIDASRADAPEIQAYAQAYASLEVDSEKALKEFTALAANAPEDGLVAFHKARLERGESGQLITFTKK
jgi:adenylate cyclase